MTLYPALILAGIGPLEALWEAPFYSAMAFTNTGFTPNVGGLEPFANQSSGVLTSAVWAEGLIDNPPGQPIACGELVRFLPFAELLS